MRFISKFTDSAGETQYALSITIRDVLLHNQIDKLLNMRLRCKSAKIIQNFLLNCKNNHHKSSIVEDIGNVIDKITRQSSTDAEIKEKLDVNDFVLKQAKDSYETMIENEKLGYVCMVEKCFIFIGINPAEQSLLLAALKQLAQLDRMVSYTLF